MADLLRMEGLTPHRPWFSLQNRGFVISSYHLQGETSTARLFHTAFAPEHPSQTARTLAARPQSSRWVVPIRMVGIHADVHGHAIARGTGGGRCSSSSVRLVEDMGEACILEAADEGSALTLLQTSLWASCSSVRAGCIIGSNARASAAPGPERTRMTCDSCSAEPPRPTPEPSHAREAIAADALPAYVERFKAERRCMVEL